MTTAWVYATQAVDWYGLSKSPYGAVVTVIGALHAPVPLAFVARTWTV